ncbi:NUDIX domain-containing protein [Lapidilactobacillus mulanensis]|uniref:NUDIX domain-containing protein n=1 Tax=Lapidilactobacillus mulanensis TaxID=2485999 RepID=A0ABW4DN24_9LACO|nr:NUDIX domain-containing protein [Lapidilactobacillus mulanensis]
MAEMIEQLQIMITNVIWSFDRDNSQVNVLLVKRSDAPYQDYWALPETFMRVNESADAAALRLVKEKIGLKLSSFHTEQLATFTAPQRSLADEERTISLAYMTFLPERPVLRAGYGAADARWFALSNGSQYDGYRFSQADLLFHAAAAAKATDYYAEFKNHYATEQLAFDHEWILKTACVRIKNKLDYLPNVLLILGDSFTLREARLVYAPFLITNVHEIDNSNFRKTHKFLFEEVGTSSKKTRGRPAMLYQLR